MKTQIAKALKAWPPHPGCPESCKAVNKTTPAPRPRKDTR